LDERFASSRAVSLFMPWTLLRTLIRAGTYMGLGGLRGGAEAEADAGKAYRGGREEKKTPRMLSKGQGAAGGASLSCRPGRADGHGLPIGCDGRGRRRHP
jgi:hypothetical protein